jgi:hypothetical protein
VGRHVASADRLQGLRQEVVDPRLGDEEAQVLLERGDDLGPALLGRELARLRQSVAGGSLPVGKGRQRERADPDQRGGEPVGERLQPLVTSSWIETVPDMLIVCSMFMLRPSASTFMPVSMFISTSPEKSAEWTWPAARSQ